MIFQAFRVLRPRAVCLTPRFFNSNSKQPQQNQDFLQRVKKILKQQYEVNKKDLHSIKHDFWATYTRVLNKISINFSKKQKKIYLFLAGVFIALVAYNEYVKGKYGKLSSLNQIQEKIRKGDVYTIRFLRSQNSIANKDLVLVSSNEGKLYSQIGSLEGFLFGLQKIYNELKIDQKDWIPVQVESSTGFNQNYLVYMTALLYISYKFNKKILFQLGNFNGNKSFELTMNVKTKFKDVAGLDEAKIQITQFVDFMKDSSKFHRLGARIPKGALLNGPPGTGKTLLAKACAGQAQVPFFYVSGSEFIQKYVGQGSARVRELFSQAKKKAPAIIFIDQIDAIGKKRDSSYGDSQTNNTLNQLLVQMDGFQSKTNLVVLAATNRKQLLDSALIRPGRFDRSVQINLPDIGGRTEIFKVHLSPLKLSPQKKIGQYARRLAALTPGFSGADIANLCNQAAITAVRRGNQVVTSKDFQQASDRILAGVQRKKIVSTEQRKTTAYHQSGHAVAAWFLQGASPLLKLTIIPRSKGSLGFAQYLPTQSTLQTKQELLDRICFILGGRCAEQMIFNRITTGAYDDLKKAYKIAHAMVCKLGMSQRIGYIGFKQQQHLKSFSEETNKIIDEEIKRIMEECTEKTRKLLQFQRQRLESLAQSLLERQTLVTGDITKILGERPFPPKKGFKEYLQNESKSD